MDRDQSEEIRFVLLEQCCEFQQQVAEQDKHIGRLWDTVIEYAEHIEKLEAAAPTMSGLTAIETTKALGQRVEKLEVVLLDVVRCLIDGKVDKAAVMQGELHDHRILGSESVQAMVEIYHRLRVQMGDLDYDTS